MYLWNYCSMIILKLNSIDSIYYTVITVETVGYGDKHPTTYMAKIFTLTLSLLGIEIITYIFSTIFENVSNEIKRRQVR
nr:potassium channel family protein [uncultured Methanobrevibacter sp.]